MTATTDHIVRVNHGALIDATLGINRVKKGMQSELTPEQVATVHAYAVAHLDDRHPDVRTLASCVVALAKTVSEMRGES